MKKSKILITVDEETLKRIDQLADIFHIKNRSALIRYLINREFYNNEILFKN